MFWDAGRPFLGCWVGIVMFSGCAVRRLGFGMALRSPAPQPQSRAKLLSLRKREARLQPRWPAALQLALTSSSRIMRVFGAPPVFCDAGCRSVNNMGCTCRSRTACCFKQARVSEKELEARLPCRGISTLRGEKVSTMYSRFSFREWPC
jgi:hypothetical protein